MSCQHTRTGLSGHLLCTFNEGKQEGMDLERERIIRVIEDNVGNMTAEIIITLITQDPPKACKCKQ